MKIIFFSYFFACLLLVTSLPSANSASIDASSAGTDRVKRQECFQDWHNKCKRDDQCCSRWCHRPVDENGYKWKWGLCKPTDLEEDEDYNNTE